MWLSIIASLFLLINQDRTDNGLNPVNFCQELQPFAIERANDQVAWNQLNHYKNNTLAIYSAITPTRWYIGENLAGWKEPANPEQINNALMNSLLHRKNILQPEFKCVAIGINDSGNILAEIFTV